MCQDSAAVAEFTKIQQVGSRRKVPQASPLPGAVRKLRDGRFAAGRLLDRADCAHLLRENRDTLEVRYLNEWAAKLQLVDALGEVWREAYGSSSAPPA